MLCDDLEGCSGEWREAQEGGDVCVIIAELHCMAETNTTL